MEEKLKGVENMTLEEFEKYRESLDPDAMGFSDLEPEAGA